MIPVDAWLSLMTGLVAAYRHDVDDRALAAHLEALIPHARDVFVATGSRGGTRRLLEAAIRIVASGKTARGGMPQPAYARALMAIRQDMRGTKARGDLLRKFLVSPDVSQKQQQLANVALAMLAPDTGTVERKAAVLTAKAAILPDRTLKSMLVADGPDPGEQPRHLREVRHVVGKLVGRDDLLMSAEEKADAKQRDPNRYQRYLDLHKKITATWKSFVRDSVRTAGHPLRVADVVSAMRAAHVDYHPLDDLVRARMGNVKIDEECKLYTPQGKLLEGGVPTKGSIIMPNGAYDPANEDTFYYKFRVPHAIGDGTKVYTVGSRKANKDEASVRILDAVDSVPEKRHKWIRDLQSGDPQRRTLGAMAELIWELVPRIGSPGNSKDGKPTYGLSTWKVGHVRINDGTLIINYTGKAGVRQSHVLRPGEPEHARAIAVIRRLMQGKERNQDLWTNPNGRRISGADFNAYLKSIGIHEITAHEFRDIRGTSMMKDALDRVRIPRGASPTQVAATVKKLALRVGQLLGHKTGNKRPDPKNPGKFITPKVTANTAIKAYIVPSVISDFFERRGERVPDWVPAGGRGKD